MRHEIEAGTFDTDGHRHSTKVAWRALAQLQEELEKAYGLPLPRNVLGPTPPAPDSRMVYVHDQGGAPQLVDKADTVTLTRNPRPGQRETYDPTNWREEADGSLTNISAYTNNGQPKKRP